MRHAYKILIAKHTRKMSLGRLMCIREDNIKMIFKYVKGIQFIYRVIHKSLRVFRPLRYSTRMVTQKGSMSTEGETLQVPATRVATRVAGT
jgi:hypothetical protein